MNLIRFDGGLEILDCDKGGGKGFNYRRSFIRLFFLEVNIMLYEFRKNFFKNDL